MLRFYSRFILLPLVIFTAVLLLIHAQPYDDHELRQLLLPDGCPAPCFMGIRPGATTADEAISLLRANKWVDHVEDGMYQILWSWSNQTPSWISKDQQGAIFVAAKIVQSVSVYTEIPLGSTRLMLGVPDMEVVDNVDIIHDKNGQNVLYFASYYQNGLTFQSRQPCKGTEPFRVPVQLGLSETSNPPSTDVNFLTLTDVFHVC